MWDNFFRFLIFFIEILKCTFIVMFLLAAFIGFLLLVPIAIAIGLMVLPVCLFYIIIFWIEDKFYGEGD